MKYKAKQLNDGTWAVTAGPVQIWNDRYETEHQAQEAACIRSAHWYREQERKCRDAWIKLHPTPEWADPFDHECALDSTWRDLMA